jgi:hypothetical protein
MLAQFVALEIRTGPFVSNLAEFVSGRETLSWRTLHNDEVIVTIPNLAESLADRAALSECFVGIVKNAQAFRPHKTVPEKEKIAIFHRAPRCF